MPSACIWRRCDSRPDVTVTRLEVEEASVHVLAGVQPLASESIPLEQASGQRVVGFRAAQGWLTPADLWVLRVLAELDFAYDSSIKPILRDWSGEPWRRFVHCQAFGERELWEIPFSSARVAGLDIPIAGGNYFRQWPH